MESGSAAFFSFYAINTNRNAMLHFSLKIPTILSIHFGPQMSFRFDCILVHRVRELNNRVSAINNGNFLAMHFIVHDFLFGCTVKMQIRCDKGVTYATSKIIEKEQESPHENYAIHFVIGCEKTIYAYYYL